MRIFKRTGAAIFAAGLSTMTMSSLAAGESTTSVMATSKISQMCVLQLSSFSAPRPWEITKPDLTGIAPPEVAASQLVTLSYCVSEEGRTSNISFAGQTGSGAQNQELINSLSHALSEWKFQPATFDGKSVSVCGCQHSFRY